MPVWDHARFGYPLQEGYSVKVTNKSKSKQAFGGTDRMRAGNPNASIEVSCVFKFDFAQFSDFKDFWAEELNYGEEYVTVTLLTAKGLNQEDALIIGGYDFSMFGNSYRVRFKFVLMDIQGS